MRMPFPLVPAIMAGTSILGNVLNAASTNRQNQKARDFSMQMYNRQRQDALADWTMQNEYNSPSSQMARYRDAGLNPHLIYGTGTASAGQASTPRSADSPSWRPDPAHYDFSGVGGAAMGFYDLAIKEATVDNLKAQNTVQVQDAALKAAQTASTTQATAKSEFELELAKSLRLTSIEAAQASLRNLNIQGDIALNQDERAALQSRASLAKTAEEILSMRLTRAKTDDERRLINQQIESVRKDVRLKQLDIELKQKGIMPGDPLYARILARVLDGGSVPALDGDFRTTFPNRKAFDSLFVPKGGDPYRKQK